MSNDLSVPSGEPHSIGENNVNRDRRRFPRHHIVNTTARVPLVVQAEVLDISETGALLRSDPPLEVGDSAELYAVVAGQAFHAGVSVVDVRPDRVAPATDDDALLQGSPVSVAFTSLDTPSEELLRKFLRAHPSSGRASLRVERISTRH